MLFLFKIFKDSTLLHCLHWPWTPELKHSSAWTFGILQTTYSPTDTCWLPLCAIVDWVLSDYSLALWLYNLRTQGLWLKKIKIILYSTYNLYKNQGVGDVVSTNEVLLGNIQTSCLELGRVWLWLLAMRGSNEKDGASTQVSARSLHCDITLLVQLNIVTKVSRRKQNRLWMSHFKIQLNVDIFLRK